jgi:uroporphyrinogen decarboxylase
VEFDYFYFAEDFAYKNGPLLSPTHFRSFFLPHYRRLVDRLHQAGIRTILLDSDGNCEALIPSLLDVGINAIEPLEAAAGMDPVQLRKEYPNDLILMGGLDKRAVAAGPEAIERELRCKILPLRDRGGYIPHLDHLFTHDIAYSNLLYYLELKARLCSAE